MAYVVAPACADGSSLPVGLSIYGDDVDDADLDLYEGEDEELFTILF